MVALVLLAALLAPQLESSSSLSGRYSVHIGSEARSGVLVLDVRGGRVRGAIGPNDQSPPFENASFDGTTVTFTTGTAPIRWRLRFGGPTIEGEWRRGDEVVPLSVKRIGDLRTEDRLRLLPLLTYEDAANRSPRIVALREQLEAGERGAADAFWATVAAQGKPLVEAIAGTDDAFLVTFLWRGTSATRNVLLSRGRFTFQHPPQNHPVRAHRQYRCVVQDLSAADGDTIHIPAVRKRPSRQSASGRLGAQRTVRSAESTSRAKPAWSPRRPVALSRRAARRASAALVTYTRRCSDAHPEPPSGFEHHPPQ